ncbi:MAG: putative metal-binding motif-containing protein, partial [Saprospiraceae bacterium]
SVLTDCCGIHNLLESGGVSGAIFITNNDTGCDSQAEITTYCGDADNDGVNINDGDCDDNPATGANNFPGNTETCDGQDNDCDSDVDEGLSGETYVGSVTFNSQAAVDAWPSCFTTISGNLTINGADITDLSPLSALTSVGVGLLIYNNGMLANLNGLSSLNSVGGLIIQNNSTLANLNGLSALTSVGGIFDIYNNGTLSNLDGLSALTSVGGDLYIQSNSALTDCCGIHGLLESGGVNGGGIYISSNDTGCDSQAEITFYCGDADNDGVSINDGDCDDNPATGANNFPGNTEICDGQDNDCHGDVDEGLSSETYAGDVTFTTQAQVDAWPSCFTAISGNLTISGADITDLSPLLELTSVVGGLLIINNSMLSNLNGLSAITSVGDGLGIQYNGTLANVDGLSALTSVGRDLLITNNGTLANLDGLSALTSVDDLFISSNGALSNLDGLSALTSVGGDLSIYYNSSLSNLDGLSAITSVGGNLDIRFNDALTDCCGIHSLLESGGVGVLISISSNDTGCDSQAEITFYCGDADNDGVNINDGDCDDDLATGANNFPGNTEICDGQDNDCDGDVDEGLSNETYMGDVTFSSQAAVDAWPPCFTAISGNLFISGADITDLSPLSFLTSVGQHLSIQSNPALASLDGLSAPHFP